MTRLTTVLPGILGFRLQYAAQQGQVIGTTRYCAHRIAMGIRPCPQAAQLIAQIARTSQVHLDTQCIPTTSMTAKRCISRTGRPNAAISHTVARDRFAITHASCGRNRAKRETVARESLHSAHSVEPTKREAPHIENPWSECRDIAHRSLRWVRDRACKLRKESREVRERRERIPP